MTFFKPWLAQVLGLSMLLTATTAPAEQAPSRALDLYSAWTVHESSERLEISKHYRADHQQSQSTLVLLTPDGTRAVIETHYEPKRDRWTITFRDLESGWWAEEILDTDLSYADMEEANRWALHRLVQEHPSVSVSFQTSDGFFVEELVLPNLSVDQERMTVDMVQKALDWHEEELGPVEPTTLSAVCGFRRLSEVSECFPEAGASDLLDSVWLTVTSQHGGDPSCPTMELRAAPPDASPSKAMIKLQKWLDLNESESQS